MLFLRHFCLRFCMLLCCARYVTAAALRAESTGGPALDYKPHDISLSKLAGRFAFFHGVFRAPEL